MRLSTVHGFSVLAALAMIALAGCGGPLHYKIPSSRLAPGGDAEITANINESQNQTALEVKVMNLPPASRVNPNAKVFVAWQRKGENGIWARLGTLKFDEEKRTGDLAATVPEQVFDFEISAEADEGAKSPSADIVFAQRVAR